MAADPAVPSNLPLNVPTMTEQYNRGEYALAEFIGKRVLTTEPTNLAVHYLLGNIYVKWGAYDRAEAEYKYCGQHGYGSQIGKYADTAMKQMRNRSPNADSDATVGSTSNASSTNNSSNPAFDSLPAAPLPPDKMDLETLEYKERVLKAGADLVAANRVKLARQIDAARAEAERQHVSPEARIRALTENCAVEEQKITAYYQAQAAAIGTQKADLGSQASTKKGDVRLVKSGSGLFVRNYINYHGEVPLPPPPPELRATALSLHAVKTGALKKAPVKKPAAKAKP